MSEDLSEGEKGDLVSDMSAHGDSIRGRMPGIGSVDAMENWASQPKDKKLYIVLIRHGFLLGSLLSGSIIQNLICFVEKLSLDVVRQLHIDDGVYFFLTIGLHAVFMA